MSPLGTATLQPSNTQTLPSRHPAQFDLKSTTSADTNQVSEDVLKLTGVGGWLRFLVVVLTVIGPLFALGTLGNLKAEFDPIIVNLPVLRDLLNMVIFFTFATTIWSIVVGYRLTKVYADAPNLAKWFFILTPVIFLVQSFLMLSINGLPKESTTAMATGLVPEFIKTLVSSVIWYLYLVKSKRVRYTFPDPLTHILCPDCRKFVFAKSAICPHCKAKLMPQLGSHPETELIAKFERSPNSSAQHPQVVDTGNGQCIGCGSKNIRLGAHEGGRSYRCNDCGRLMH